MKLQNGVNIEHPFGLLYTGGDLCQLLHKGYLSRLMHRLCNVGSNRLRPELCPSTLKTGRSPRQDDTSRYNARLLASSDIVQYLCRTHPRAGSTCRHWPGQFSQVLTHQFRSGRIMTRWTIGHWITGFIHLPYSRNGRHSVPTRRNH